MTFGQRFATACFLLLTSVTIYAMFTGKLDISLAISAITGLIASVLAGRSLLEVIKKPNDKELKP